MLYSLLPADEGDVIFGEPKKIGILVKLWESLGVGWLSRICGTICNWESAGPVEAVCEAGLEHLWVTALELS